MNMRASKQCENCQCNIEFSMANMIISNGEMPHNIFERLAKDVKSVPANVYNIKCPICDNNIYIWSKLKEQYKCQVKK